MMKWFRHWLINFLTRHLLKAVTIDEVLLISGKDWLLNKRKLSHEEILMIKEEAQSFRQSLFWKLLIKELKYRATLQRFDKAKTPDDMFWGKAMIDCIEKIDIFSENISKL